jgi:hypothetical protein
VEIFDPCSTTRTLLILSSLCERFLLVFNIVLLIWAGGDDGNAAFGSNGNAVVCIDKGSDPEFGALGEWAYWRDPVPVSMSSNSTSEWLPASMSVLTRLLERRIFRKNAMFFKSAFSVPVPSLILFGDGVCCCRHGSDLTIWLLYNCKCCHSYCQYKHL